MRLRFSLFTKILLWFFLNLTVIGTVMFVVIHLHFHLAPSLFGGPDNQIAPVARSISDEIRGLTREERDAVLKHYDEAYQAKFSIYSVAGENLAGPSDLPPEILQNIRQVNWEMYHEVGWGPPHRFPPGARNPGGPNRTAGPPPPPPPPGHRPPPAPPIFSQKTENPTRYWGGVRIPVFEPGQTIPSRAILLASSDSVTGHGLFFDPRPWVIAATAVFGLSILLWLPFVSGLTRFLHQMTTAAEQIAEERFDVRVNEKRTDELGRLGKAINHLAFRLSGFVSGQKRFLGDISHELNSPLARMQVALGILETRVDPTQLDYVKDVQEEVELMSRLVHELLAYSKAGIKATNIQLERIKLLPLVQQVSARETTGEATLDIAINDQIEVAANDELLSRALANIIRNAVRYGGSGGTITVSAERQNEQVKIVVADCGPGVPDEVLSKLFDPFYRLEADRARNTGGTGLGLAIVKSCITACQGTVAAANRKPSGLEISITLMAT